VETANRVCDPEAGSATIASLGLVAAVTAVAVAAAWAGAVQVAAATAQGAADAAALAGADQARDSRALATNRADPCDTAGSVVRAWGLTRWTCATAADGSVTVRVWAPTAVGAVRRAARAGTP
jgi:hypothetical protein